MKTNELMLGDIITFKDSVEIDETPVPVKVITMWRQRYGHENEALVKIGDTEICDIVTIDDGFVGYPLTSEILKKNGFECRGAWCLPGEDLGLRQDGDSWGLLSYYVEYDALAFCHIKYVHELQHALRLCGIEKEIVL